jgi:hypothetical protein
MSVYPFKLSRSQYVVSQILASDRPEFGTHAEASGCFGSEECHCSNTPHAYRPHVPSTRSSFPQIIPRNGRLGTASFGRRSCARDGTGRQYHRRDAQNPRLSRSKRLGTHLLWPPSHSRPLSRPKSKRRSRTSISRQHTFFLPRPAPAWISLSPVYVGLGQAARE